MSTFNQLYNPADTIWNIYLQFAFAELEAEGTPSVERVVQWFSEYPGFDGFPCETGSCFVALKNVTAKSIEVISLEKGVEFLTYTITQAIHYNSNERLKEGQAGALALAFMAEFESPLMFCNWSLGNEPFTGSGCYDTVTDAELGYTEEFFLCCIDRRKIGFAFSLTNE